jgi:hypothetical protein
MVFAIFGVLQHFCTLDSVQVLDLQIPEALREAIEVGHASRVKHVVLICRYWCAQQTTVFQQRIFRAQFNQNAQRVAAETEKITVCVCCAWLSATKR